MDRLRSCYRTSVRFFKDSEETTDIQWYFTKKPWLDVPTTFSSRNWVSENGQWAPLIGEVCGAERKWVNGKPPRGARQDGEPQGSAEEWAEGCTLATTEDQGILLEPASPGNILLELPSSGVILKEPCLVRNVCSQQKMPLAIYGKRETVVGVDPTAEIALVWNATPGFERWEYDFFSPSYNAMVKFVFFCYGNAWAMEAQQLLTGGPIVYANGVFYNGPLPMKFGFTPPSVYLVAEPPHPTSPGWKVTLNAP